MNDKVVVLEAVKQYGEALQYADDSLKKDREVVLEAVKADGAALIYADASFKYDKEVFVEALKNNYDTEYDEMHDVFINNPDILALINKNKK